MKKLLICFLIALCSVSSLFAEDDKIAIINPAENAMYSALLKPYSPTSPRRLAMGNAGLAVANGSDSLYYNPAGLAEKRLVIALPSVAFTVYHPYGLLKNGVVDDLKSFDANDSEKLTQLVFDLKKALGNNYTKVMDMDASTGFTAGGFGLMINVKDTVHSYRITSSDGGIFDQLNASITIGYGHRINIATKFSIDIGAAVKFNYLAFSKGIALTDVLDKDKLNDPMNKIVKTLPVMAGFSVPFDIGVNFNLPLNFKLGVVAKNINGKMYMNSFENYESALKNPLGSSSNSNKFEYNTDFSLDAGFAWSWKNSFFAPTIAVDVVDTIGLFKNSFNMRNFIYHLNAGAEFRVLSFLDLRGGFNQGYWTLGAGLDLWAIKMDVAYFWEELGSTAGANSTDGLSIKFNIGLDR